MTYVMSVSIILISGYIGKRLSEKFIFKDRFYKEMINFTIHLKNNILFGQKKIEEIFEKLIIRVLEIIS